VDEDVAAAFDSHFSQTNDSTDQEQPQQQQEQQQQMQKRQEQQQEQHQEQQQEQHQEQQQEQQQLEQQQDYQKLEQQAQHQLQEQQLVITGSVSLVNSNASCLFTTENQLRLARLWAGDEEAWIRLREAFYDQKCDFICRECSSKDKPVAIKGAQVGLLYFEPLT